MRYKLARKQCMSEIIDISGLDRLESDLSKLDSKNMNDALYKSLRKGAKVLSDATRQSLISKMGDAATRPIRKPKKYGDGTYKPLIENITVGGDKGYCEVKVTILHRGGYLHWFEKGTNMRQTSKGANRGSIGALNFFFNARQSSFGKMESTIIDTLDKEIDKRIKDL